MSHPLLRCAGDAAPLGGLVQEAGSMNIKSISIPLAKQIEKEIKENPVGVVIAEALIYKAIESAQHNVQRTAVAWFFIGGFVFLGIRWIMFGG